MGCVILLEFNELTPVLMERFIAAGHLPHFKRLRDESVTAITDAGEDPPYLEPWIQWVTVHTGLPYREHKVFDLGDGPKLKAPRIWDMVSDSGRAVWVCGSMNAAIQSSGINGQVLPDPWATGLRPVPDREFAPFFDFVRAYVQEHTRDRPPLQRRDYLRLGRFMLSHGLSLATVMAGLRQLGGEIGGHADKWKRAVILDAMLWDVFRHGYRRLNPAFATFFLNSTAHFQHYYWRAHEPEAFALTPDAVPTQSLEDAILFGYRKMDTIVADALRLAGPDTTIVLCTALGQEPLTRYDADGGRLLFRPTKIADLLHFAGIAAEVEIAPVMAEEFRLYFRDAAATDRALEQLMALRLDDGHPLMRVRMTGPLEIYCGCAVWATPAPGTMVVAGESNRTQPFGTLFYPIDAGIKSGMHHRDGLLWIRKLGLAPHAIDRTVSLEELAPTLLALCDVAAPVAFPRPPMPELTKETAHPLKAA